MPGDRNVPLSARGIVEIAFNEDVARLMDFGNFSVEDSTGMIPGEIVPQGIGSEGYHYTFQTSQRPFFAAMIHTVRLSDRITDFSGNQFAGAEWSFTTVEDATPPTATLVTPSSLIGVPIDTAIEVDFSEALVGVDMSTFTLTGPTGSVVSNLTTSIPIVTARLDPLSPLLPSTAYTVSLSSSITDLGGNALLFTPVTFTTTADMMSPEVQTITPAMGSTNVNVAASLSVAFSETVTNVNTTTFTLTGPSGMIGGLVTTGASNATLNPFHQLLPFTTYTVALSTAIVDVASNPLIAFSGSFTTGADTVTPSILERFPLPGATNVPINTTVRADFDEEITNADATTFTLVAGAAVPGTVAFEASPTQQRATLTPSTQLAPNTTYTATLSSSLQDATGNLLGTNSVWTFTTAPDTITPTVITTVPADDATGVALNATISVTFDEPVVNVDGTSFIVMNAGTGTLASSNGGRTWTWAPDADMPANTTVSIMLTMAIEDAAGNALAAPVTFDFTTAP